MSNIYAASNSGTIAYPVVGRIERNNKGGIAAQLQKVNNTGGASFSGGYAIIYYMGGSVLFNCTSDNMSTTVEYGYNIQDIITTQCSNYLN